jgi:hypothetical protein
VHERVGGDVDGRSHDEDDRRSQSQCVQRTRQNEGRLPRSVADQDRVEARRRGADGREGIVRAFEADRLVPSAATISSWPSTRSRSSSTMSTVPQLLGHGRAISSTVAALLSSAADSHASKRLSYSGELTTFIAPSWSRTVLRTVARPRPVPARRVVKNGSKTSLTPGPLSVTMKRT